MTNDEKLYLIGLYDHMARILWELQQDAAKPTLKRPVRKALKARIIKQESNMRQVKRQIEG